MNELISITYWVTIEPLGWVIVGAAVFFALRATVGWALRTYR